MSCSRPGGGGGACEASVVVTEDLWSERDTNPDAIADALRGLLHERHSANETLAPARVLNLVVIVDREWKGEIANRLARVGRYHASRTVLCAVEQGRTTLDARAVMSYEEPTGGGNLGVMLEQVEIDMGPEHLERIDTVVDPILWSELPTVLWTPHGHEEAVERLLGMIEVLLLDSDEVLEPEPGLRRASRLLNSAYVVDLAWLRTTPWRERLAASFDPPDRLAMLERITRVAIRHRPSSPTSPVLLAGWLASRLGWSAAGKAKIVLEGLEQEAPGLAGVTVESDDSFSLSLDRASGGLRARERVNGTEHVWRVLGASRGEGGILGEGVRQALLRDPTYGPALDAAIGFCG
jgi:glucose-6-phosphate dehydrogenase assembly protein OpcA